MITALIHHLPLKGENIKTPESSRKLIFGGSLKWDPTEKGRVMKNPLLNIREIKLNQSY